MTFEEGVQDEIQKAEAAGVDLRGAIIELKERGQAEIPLRSFLRLGLMFPRELERAYLIALQRSN